MEKSPPLTTIRAAICFELPQQRSPASSRYHSTSSSPAPVSGSTGAL